MGGRRKGFHLAALGESRVVELGAVSTPGRAADWAEERLPICVAVDSPAEWAPLGQSSRPCEREFARAGICGIRFTPSEEVAAARADVYYEWIEHGLELWSELRRRGLRVVECFPTASWTHWSGPRQRSRAVWTRRALATVADATGLELDDARNQDQRDAVAAALTARQAERRPGSVQRFGHLVVPRSGELQW